MFVEIITIFSRFLLLHRNPGEWQRVRGLLVLVGKLHLGRPSLKELWRSCRCPTVRSRHSRPLSRLQIGVSPPRVPVLIFSVLRLLGPLCLSIVRVLRQATRRPIATIEGRTLHLSIRFALLRAVSIDNVS